MASSKKTSAGAGRSKPVKGRPPSTSTLAHLSQSNSPSILSAFSPDATLFAFVVLAIDRHRLRVYDSASGRAVSEYTVDSARVSSLKWATLTSDSPGPEQNSPSKKRKKTSVPTAAEKDSSSRTEVVALGLSDGIVIFFSPSHSQVLRTLTHPKSTSAVLSLAFDPSNGSALWTSSADGSICLWDVQNKTVLRSWKNDDHIPCTSLSVCPTLEGHSTSLLAAHHSIRLFKDIANDNSLSKPMQVAGFTGHATSIQLLLWFNESEKPTKFFSMAEGDRFVYCWDVEGASLSEKPVAAISLDADVRTFALATPVNSQQCLIALSTSGKLSFVPIPSKFPSSTDKSNTIATILPRSTVSSTSKFRAQDPQVIDLVPLPTSPGLVRVVRLVKGIQPTFDTISYLDDSANYIHNPILPEINQEDISIDPQRALNNRYVESKQLTVGSGHDVNQEDVDGSLVEQEFDGFLQVDLAEMSLGQRLTAVTETEANHVSESEDEYEQHIKRSKATKKARSEVAAIPTNSLTRTLIQALHSSDSRLLEMCLGHSDPALILNTVRRLPPQLTIPLITACVERLGRGPRSSNMKGGGGGTSSQRGSGLLTWLRTVLTVHTGHLMTIPDLVARLSGLHATLTARSSLHDSLLSLSGRLDMVLSQVELRASTTPASLAPLKANKKRPEATVRRYIEGDTESSDEPDDKMDVEVEMGSEDEGSLEDIELGGDSDEDEEEYEDLSDGDSGGNFIDDEAEEEDFTGDEDEDESD
ncbi:U3 small nucleolar RNA-associated protein 5 [Psilocybe cubensis]|uniref:U3 small nucleolar RNA-associated protein 5 n=2 Tax=Psilocybe cubensis TaxID=181762 RepID=A0ACB8HHS8_PSICU|nr:U3 small nucleolar RNA-associated protein 5 [Psilocybe cubensis]KAH9486680.1 U3 small nucleolar RNA-associated protein 5 [Psilocybe cubensis]